MTLRKARSTEQFTDEELRTGFRENEPAFKKWKKANKLLEITHMKYGGSNICEGGTIYRTRFQLEEMSRVQFGCGCDKGKRCTEGYIRKSQLQQTVIPWESSIGRGNELHPNSLELCGKHRGNTSMVWNYTRVKD